MQAAAELPLFSDRRMMKGMATTLEQRRGRDGVDSVGRYLQEIGRVPLPTSEEQDEMARRVATGDAEARNAMVAANLRLVVRWAKAYQGQGVDLLDLIQEGAFGLTKAVEKYDLELGFRFSTYATFWIRQSLQRAIVKGGRTIYVPEGQLRKQLENADADDLPRVTASLDMPTGEDGSSALSDLIADDADGPDDIAGRTVVRDALHAAIDRVPEPGRSVIRLRFGLDGEPPASLDRIAKVVGLGRQMVRRAEYEAIAVLKNEESLADLAEVLES